MAVFNEIRSYFERNKDLHVLFVFDQMESMQTELSDPTLAPWEEYPDYEYVVFDGGWFNLKYKIETEWKDKKVVLVFNSEKNPAPTNSDAMLNFPLLDTLAANMQFMPIKYEAFCQEHRLPIDKFGSYVQRHIKEFTYAKFEKLFKDSLDPSVFSIDLGNRGFISGYLGESHILQWDEIFIRLIMISTDRKKEDKFYKSMFDCQDVLNDLQQHLQKTFARQALVNKEVKMKEVAESLKYNAITQLLSIQNADPYKEYKVSNSIALEEMNRILALAQAMPKQKSEVFFKALETLSQSIRVSEIINIYGVDAEYYYVPEELCWAIIAKCAKEAHIGDAGQIAEKMQALAIKQEGETVLLTGIQFVHQMAEYYHLAKQIGSMTFDQPNDYVVFYRMTFYKIDKAYRKTVGLYYEMGKESPCQNILDEAKARLDNEYWVLSHGLNVEWQKCIADRGMTFADVKLDRQQDFFKSIHFSSGIKQVVIISDALRYEVADDLYFEMAKQRHLATFDAAMAQLPTWTEYTKVSLLPHTSLRFADKQLMVDDVHLGDTVSRTKHLERYIPKAKCVTYSQVKQNNREQNRELFKAPLVYVFHDVIDDDGHKDDPQRLTNACKTAVQELEWLVRHIHDANISSIWITSDHGFLFNDMNFLESNKVAAGEESDKVIEKKSRYYLTTSSENIHAFQKFPLSDVSAMQGDFYVAVPIGAIRVKASNESYRFAHGGASLQEMVIPVIHSKIKDENKKEKVNVQILGQRLNMVSSRLKFKIIQAEAVDMNTLARTVVCAVYDGETPVTAENEVILGSESDDFNKRIFEVELTLNKSVANRILTLRIYDSSDRLNVLAKANVTNSTIIEQDEW